MVVFWRDPVTSIYTVYEQHEMSSQLGETFEQWQKDARKSGLGVKAATPAGTHGGATVHAGGPAPLGHALGARFA